MVAVDAFNSSMFNTQSLSAAIMLAPHKPRLLGALGVFNEKPIRTTTAWVEKQGNRIALINTANRGTVKDVRDSIPRNAFAFRVPHVPYFQTVLADDIQNIRAFGSESELQGLAQYINEQLVAMRDDHEATQEFHRIGAMKGTILDADNSTVIVNLYTQFGLAQPTQNWAAADAHFGPTATAVIRKIADALGSDVFTGIVALCGDGYFDGIIKHASMTAAYERWRDGEFLRVSHLGPEWAAVAANGFMYQNILFYNYRGKIGDVTFIPTNEAYYFPTGIRDFFQEIIAPADFSETVNTLGQRYYAKQERMQFDKGVQLHTQSNTLAMCTRPDAVVKSTYTP